MTRVLFLLVFLLGTLAAACGAEGSESEPTPAPSSTGTTPTATPAPTLEPGDYPQLGAYTGVEHVLGHPSFQPLDGATVHHGTLGGAMYRVEVPGDWNGELVVWAHGFKGFGTELDVDSPPRALREHIVRLGYAWAASSYSENGYAPGIGADDTLAVREFFAEEFGEPSRTYLVGASMGGNVVALSLEHFPGAYDGALSICGALGGQTQIDFLVSWAHLAAFFAGTELPLEEGALAVVRTLTGEVSEALGPVDAPTIAGMQFASTIRMLTGGPRPFFLEGFQEQYLLNFGYILSDPAIETLTARGATNADTVYTIEPGLGITADEINEGVFRQVADPEVRDPDAYPDKVPTHGNLSAPLLALHNTGDLFVPISQAVEYRATVEAAGNAELLVQRAIRAAGHCQFSDAELTTAFDDLVAWVADGQRPAGEDLSGSLENAGVEFTDPLRPGDPGTP